MSSTIGGEIGAIRILRGLTAQMMRVSPDQRRRKGIDYQVRVHLELGRCGEIMLGNLESRYLNWIFSVARAAR